MCAFLRWALNGQCDDANNGIPDDETAITNGSRVTHKIPEESLPAVFVHFLYSEHETGMQKTVSDSSNE